MVGKRRRKLQEGREDDEFTTVLMDEQYIDKIAKLCPKIWPRVFGPIRLRLRRRIDNGMKRKGRQDI